MRNIARLCFICGMNKPKIQQDSESDILGNAILRHHMSNIPCEIDLFIDGEQEPSMSSAYFFRSEAEMNESEQMALDICRGRVLDVGAGAGCHSLILQQKGLKVVALEKSPCACEVLRARGVKEVIQTDVMDFSDGPFDTILLLMNGFGIGGDESGLLSLLQHLKTLLAQGGSIIGDSTDIRYFKQELDSIEEANGNFAEVIFDVRLDGLQESFPWIYPDETLLEVLAEEVGLKYRTRMYDDEFHFLSELYL
jgi:SAM-dependent methyltransferase